MWWVVGVLLYVLMAFVCGRLRYVYGLWNDAEGDVLGALMYGAFWVVYLPCTILSCLFRV